MTNSKKTVVITGISSGIGLALAKKLLHENYRVIGTTRSGNLPDLQHDDLDIVALEIADPESIERATSDIRTITDKIDGIINNAGFAPDYGALQPNRNTFNATMNTNVNGSIFFTEPLIDLVNDGGKVAFISSMMGLAKNAGADSPAYRVSKAAINMYAAVLAERLKERKICVTPIHPGWVQTKMGGPQAPFTAEQSAEGIYEGIKSNTESGKFWDITIPGTDTF